MQSSMLSTKGTPGYIQSLSNENVAKIISSHQWKTIQSILLCILSITNLTRS